MAVYGWVPSKALVSAATLFEHRQSVVEYLQWLCAGLAVDDLNMCGFELVSLLDLAQVLRLSLLAFADDQQPLIRLPHGRAPLQVAGGLPMFGLVVLPHRVNAPRPWPATASRQRRARRRSGLLSSRAPMPLACGG